MIVLRSLILTTVLFIACWFTLPPVTTAGGMGHHHGGTNGIDILLATGMVAKLLQKKKHGYHGRSNHVPIGGRAQEGHYGSQSVRIVVPHHTAAAPAPPPQTRLVPVHYQQPIQQPRTTVTYSQATHVMPQQVPQQPMAQQTMSQAPIAQPGYPGTGYPATATEQKTIYGYFTEFQPRDQLEVVRM